MGDFSSLPADIIHNILVRIPINLLMKLKYVCKRWNRVLSHPYSGPRGDRKILLPFAPVDVLEEKHMTRSLVTLNNSSLFVNPVSKVVTFAGSCKNGIVLLVIQDYYRCKPERIHMVLYNPFTSAIKPVPDDLHSKCNNSSKHVHGFGYGSTLDDLKIIRFRGCESSDDNRHTCDVFSPKTNSWITLKKFVQNADWLDDVGTFANGSLYWIANSKNYNQECDKILALDVKNMVLSDIHLPFHTSFSYYPSILGTLHGSLCVVAKKCLTPIENQFSVWVMTTAGDGVEKSWLEASSFTLNFNQGYGYRPLSILDDGMVLLLNISFPKLVIYDAMKHSHEVISISARASNIQRCHGIEYVESLVSPSSLFNNA